jgi:pimeloyl-ACP methyl ester carboxylesterase
MHAVGGERVVHCRPCSIRRLRPSRPGNVPKRLHLPLPGALLWSTVTVDGRPVTYGATGVGRTAVFLHGWGLRPHAYREPIRHLGLVGCRVVAPVLPGFGGSRGLPSGMRSFAGYAAWVGRFLDAVGIDQVDLVAGHSFGGGVATQFTHDLPNRAASLYLANAIGSPTWSSHADRVRTMAQRPVWDWGRHLSADLVRSPGLLRVIPSVLGDLLPTLIQDPLALIQNPLALIQNPLAMWQTGEFIRRADLVAELGEVHRRGTPVSVVWSDRDRLVPRSAFDDLRRAAGVEGTVVEGSHGWLLAHPARFGELAIPLLAQLPPCAARVAKRRRREIHQ